MKLACVSDIHGFWDKIVYPKADTLIFAGDILSDCSTQGQLVELRQFNLFLGKLKSNKTYREIVVCFGNHDFCSEEFPEICANLVTNAHFLQNSQLCLDGLKFYASPYQNWFWDWAWNFPKNDPAEGYPFAKKIWSQIPDDTQVLITHGPALNILDECPDGRRVGCPILAERIQELPDLKLHVVGHIHHSAGKTKVKGIQCVNASICTERYEPSNPIQIVEI